ncbi:hypothetical protein KGF86_06970 [Ornithinibacillus massiliensis]|uniref:Uncharacterized protein n=1 Tax=Ornithinibacillus massiliensis TaxID=1944633 RepID=A0ABS5MC98_9BACI|nr:hypothetical protein [Ornithinibacillus massiliensis]MBS3679949.1 hypothetical protein [Ornithinibacillus massiliensis]
MQITVNTFVKPINTYLNGMPQNETINTYTYIQPLSDHVEHFVVTSRTVKGYLSQFYFNVTTDVKSGNIDVRDIYSFVNALHSDVVTEIYRQPLKANRDVTSHIKSIQAHRDVFISTEYIPIQATVNVLENGSMSFYIINPSRSEVME